MTPKEKAQHLVDSMIRTGDPHHTECICFEIAKRCSLIAVDTVLWMASHYATIEYWQEVKQEIEQL